MKPSTFVHLFTILSIMLVATSAEAIPAFSRKEGAACSSCHTAFPALNKMGRLYKTNGFRFSQTQEPARKISEDLMLSKNFPISAGIVSRPYDKKDSGETKNRAIHEVEVMIGGSIGKNLSGFAELEAEDEENFNTIAAIIQATYSVNSAVNVQSSRAPALYFDPYNSYASSRRSTINRSVVIDEPFGGADNGSKIRKARQNFTLFGRPFTNLFYGVSYSGLAEDDEGQDATVAVARLAYDVMPNLMIGTMVLDGKCTIESGSVSCLTVDRDFRRVSIDAQLLVAENLTFNAAYLRATDDLITGLGDESNDAYYVQAFYTIKQGGRPLLMPLLRYDKYEENDGLDDISAITYGVSHYMAENLKLRLEYWDRRGAGTVIDDDRLSLQFDLFF